MASGHWKPLELPFGHEMPCSPSCVTSLWGHRQLDVSCGQVSVGQGSKSQWFTQVYDEALTAKQDRIRGGDNGT